jgi:phage replication O-like protein O
MFKVEKGGQRVVITERYTKVPNELLEGEYLKQLSSIVDQVHFIIIRETLGWGVAECQLSIGEIQEILDLSRKSVERALTTLEDKKIITRKRDGTRKTIIGLVLDPSRVARVKSVPTSSKNVSTVRDETVPSCEVETVPRDRFIDRLQVQFPDTERSLKNWLKTRDLSIYTSPTIQIDQEEMETLQSLYPQEDTQKALAITEAFTKEAGVEDRDQIRHVLCQVVMWRQREKQTVLVK